MQQHEQAESVKRFKLRPTFFCLFSLEAWYSLKALACSRTAFTNWEWRRSFARCRFCSSFMLSTWCVSPAKICLFDKGAHLFTRLHCRVRLKLNEVFWLHRSLQGNGSFEIQCDFATKTPLLLQHRKFLSLWKKCCVREKSADTATTNHKLHLGISRERWHRNAI